MAKSGLWRLPYYPQLTALFSGQHGPESLVLSALLFWNTRDAGCRFEARQHLYQLALHLNLEVPAVQEALERLTERGFLYSVTEKRLKKADPHLAANGETPPPKYEKHVYLRLNLKILAAQLQAAGLERLSPRVLRQAAADNFELYDAINPERLPLTQYLLGSVSGEDFERTARNCAALVCSVAEKDEDFALKAAAPGWRMLIQPPATGPDIAGRWLRDGERAIDFEFGAGTIFLPDSSCFRAQRHQVVQPGQCREARILAAAFLMAAACSCAGLTFCSEIDMSEIKEAAQLLYRHTGLKPELSETFCKERMLSPEETSALLKAWAQFIAEL